MGWRLWGCTESDTTEATYLWYPQSTSCNAGRVEKLTAERGARMPKPPDPFLDFLFCGDVSAGTFGCTEENKLR